MAERLRTRLAAVPAPALWLGIAATAPFVIFTILVAFAELVWSLRALMVLINYGAVALAFLGAVHWGLAMASPAEAASWRRLGWSVTPALLGWIAVNMYPIPALVVLAIGFAAAFIVDARAVESGLAPPWYKTLRRPLTTVVLISLGVAMVTISYFR